jgi:hypothetical protein
MDWQGQVDDHEILSTKNYVQEAIAAIPTPTPTQQLKTLKGYVVMSGITATYNQYYTMVYNQKDSHFENYLTFENFAPTLFWAGTAVAKSAGSPVQFSFTNSYLSDIPVGRYTVSQVPIMVLIKGSSQLLNCGDFTSSFTLDVANTSLGSKQYTITMALQNNITLPNSGVLYVSPFNLTFYWQGGQ